jgi:hypothetical protein
MFCTDFADLLLSSIENIQEYKYFKFFGFVVNVFLESTYSCTFHCSLPTILVVPRPVALRSLCGTC